MSGLTPTYCRHATCYEMLRERQQDRRERDERNRISEPAHEPTPPTGLGADLFALACDHTRALAAAQSK